MAKLCVIRAIRILVSAAIFVIAILPARADVAPRDLHDLAVDLIVSQPPHVRLADDHPYMLRAAGAARDLRIATDALIADGSIATKDRDAWERAGYAWGFFESGWHTNPQGNNDFDKACGIGQTHLSEVPATWLGPDARKDACAQARKDRVYGFRTMLRVMLVFAARCGSLRAALTAYSTDGACHPWVANVVTMRCKIAGC